MRRWRIIATALVLATLAGCSALRLAYTQADTAAYWWLNGYFEFDQPQGRRTREVIDEWFAWHQRTQLPDYAALLDRTAGQMPQDTTAEATCRLWDELLKRVDVALDHGLPGAGGVATMLGPDQLAAVEAKQAEVNREFRKDYLQDSPEARREAMLERQIERAERLYGRLDEPQRARIADAVAASPFDPERALAERIRRQAEINEALLRIQRDKLTPAQATAALRTIAQHVRVSPDADYRRYAQALTRFNCERTALLHNATTPAQRAHAVERLRGWEADLRQLAASAQQS